MKKIIPFFLVALFGLTAFSCKDDDDQIYVDYDTYPVVYDLTNIDFELIDGTYSIYKTFENPMYPTDVLLVYIQNGTTSNGSPIWQQIPITFYLSDGNEVDYNFDFSMNDVQIYAGGTFNLGGTSYVNNKTFRIVFVPASYGKNAEVDYSDYNSVIKYYDIDDSNPKEL